MSNLFFETVLVRSIDPVDLAFEMRRSVDSNGPGSFSVDFVMGYCQALFLMRQMQEETWQYFLSWSAEKSLLVDL